MTPWMNLINASLFMTFTLCFCTVQCQCVVHSLPKPCIVYRNVNYVHLGEGVLFGSTHFPYI